MNEGELILRSLELFVEQSFESRSVDDVKRFLFVREKAEGVLFDAFHDGNCLIVADLLCSDVLEGEIDNES
jgi:hypothetical protein